MDVESVALMIITLVAIGVAIGILSSMGVNVGAEEKFRGIFRDASDSIKPGESYDLCQEYDGQLVSVSEFQSVLQAASRGDCKNASVTLQTSFSLTRDDISEIMVSSEIAKSGEHVFYRSDIDSLGIGAVLVRANPGYHPIKTWDIVELSFKGTPKNDMVLTLIEEGCDPYDGKCQAMCAYMEGICDPACYEHGVRNDAPCDLDCVDADGDGKITAADRDGICDPDCYSSQISPRRAYDPDCVWENREIYDGICDPNSNGVSDGVCDPDCAINNTVCDPDCDGKITDANPSGLLDAACYICDGICSGFCSMACTRLDKDPDCPEGFRGFNNLTECCGNGICSPQAHENCETCPEDCPSAGASCEDFGKVCCPGGGSDVYGCSDSFGYIKGTQCSCDSQCMEGLACNDVDKSFSVYNKACCEPGLRWNGSHCIVTDTYDVFIVPVGVTSQEQLNQRGEELRNIFLLQTPFRECRNKEDLLRIWVADISLCQAEASARCTSMCGNCNDLGRRCARKMEAELGVRYDKFMVITPSSINGIAGCATGIPGDGAASLNRVCNTAGSCVMIHELGHAMGLGHVNCGVACHACLAMYPIFGSKYGNKPPNCPDCSQPMSEKQVYIMSYCKMVKFGQAAYNFLRDEYIGTQPGAAGLAKWMEKCER